jgi:formylmethanofuran dehydrogenase subunit E
MPRESTIKYVIRAPTSVCEECRGPIRPSEHTMKDKRVLCKECQFELRDNDRRSIAQ